MRERQVLPDPSRRFDKGKAVTVVLLHSGCDRENVRIENDVLRRKANAVHENVVCTRGDRRFLLERVVLTRYADRQDLDGSVISADQFGGANERVFTLLVRKRIDYRLALNAFQPGLDHRKFQTVDPD